MDIKIRDLRPADLPILEKMINRIVEFNEEEQKVAMELLTINATQPEQRDYLVLVAVDGQDNLLGYALYGATVLTIGTFDLYWIAVDPDWKGKGIGSQLIGGVEEMVKKANGRLLIIQTSSSPAYDKTRQFYLKNNYEMVQIIKDFYRDGEDLVTFLSGSVDLQHSTGGIFAFRPCCLQNTQERAIDYSIDLLQKSVNF